MADNKKQGDIRPRKTFWGEEYWEIRDSRGARTGDIRPRRGFWGREYLEVRDNKGHKRGELPKK